jgi:hypothetical protein
VSNYNSLLHAIAIPYTALISIVFALMIISFPIGAYIVFNSDIGDDITAEYPIENVDIFLAGIGLQLPIQLELGDVFVVTWCLFAILFVISFLGPKTNFIKTIIHYVNNKQPENENYIESIIKWFSVIILISVVINFIQENLGIQIQPPDVTNELIQFFMVTISPITEEVGFRILLIGLPLFLFYSHKSSIRFFFIALWHPARYLHVINNNKTIPLIIGVGVFFGLAHIMSGEPWSLGKITQASASGIILGWVYYKYGFLSAILVHWATNYFLLSYVFAISEINQISTSNALSHSMINSLEIILILSGITSTAIILLNYLNKRKSLLVN